VTALALCGGCSSSSLQSGPSSDVVQPDQATSTAVQVVDSSAPVPTDATTTTRAGAVESSDAAQTSDNTTTTMFVDTNGTVPNVELSKPFPAWWQIDPSFTPTPESTSLQLMVTERECASGISPTGRIETSVTYTATEVVVSVIVNSVGGFADCQGIGPTPFTLQLTEPLGNRSIIGEDPPPPL
jgi:hypothetical protein